jgi:hypothetical protein
VDSSGITRPRIPPAGLPLVDPLSRVLVGLVYLSSWLRDCVFEPAPGDL